MTLLAPTLQGFFTDRLIGQRNASPHTVGAYRDTFRLLLTFASRRLAMPAGQLRIDDLSPGVIAAFLDHLEAERGNRANVTYLIDAEIDALLDAPDRATPTGRRDHALLVLTIQTGLRISELISLTRQDLHLGTAAHVSCHGKGRKQRITPLTRSTVAVLQAWIT